MILAELSEKMAASLAAAGVEDSVFTARTLLLNICNITLEEWIWKKSEPASLETAAHLEEMVERRVAGEPLQYLLGEWDFYGNTFSVGAGVLIPRADTEVLIDAVKNQYTARSPLKIVDLCSGTGVIGLTLAKEFPESQVWLLEKSSEAMAYLLENQNRQSENRTRTNALLQDVLKTEEISTLFKKNSLDIVVSNPPYLTGRDMDELQKEVQFEPSMALYGGEDGLLFYQKITQIWREFLIVGGRIYYEVGIYQAKPVMEILQTAGFEEITSFSDIQGIERVVSGKKSCTEK